MARVDLVDYYDRGKYPSHAKVIVGLGIVFGLFFGLGVYSIYSLWTEYGPQIMTIINSLNLPELISGSIIGIVAVIGGLVLSSLVLAIGASWVARRLGGTLIYIGALMMNILAWSIVIVALLTGMIAPGQLLSAWPIMIPGMFTLFITVLLFTVFRGRIKRAGNIIKLTGQTCLDEKGVFVPPLLAMVFTLLSAVMAGAIVFRFVPFGVLLGSEVLTFDNGWPLLVAGLLYLFLTIFLYNFAYATTSGIVYIYMRGRDPSLGDGVRASLGVLGGLIALSIMSVIVAIVRMIIRAISREAGPGGQVVGGFAEGIIGWVWAMMNYFTIPAMVAEELGATKGIKRSISLVRNNLVDVIIKETAVRWAFMVLAFMFFLAFGVGGFVVGYFLNISGPNAMLYGFVFAVVAIIFAAIPSVLVLRTFDIVYITLLYVFIRKKEGEIRGKTAIPSSMQRELTKAYNSAQRGGS